MTSAPAVGGGGGDGSCVRWEQRRRMFSIYGNDDLNFSIVQNFHQPSTEKLKRMLGTTSIDRKFGIPIIYEDSLKCIQ